MLDSATGTVPLSGSIVSGVAFYSYRIEISIEGGDGEQLVLAIGGPFVLADPAGARAALDTEGDWTALGALLELKFAELVELRIDAQSNLRLTTKEGWAIEIRGDSGYENWDLSGHGRKWIGRAGGGEPHYWPPNAESVSFKIGDRRSPGNQSPNS
jgi:hypothetical protein